MGSSKPKTAPHPILDWILGTTNEKGSVESLIQMMKSEKMTIAKVVQNLKDSRPDKEVLGKVVSKLCLITGQTLRSFSDQELENRLSNGQRNQLISLRADPKQQRVWKDVYDATFSPQTMPAKAAGVPTN